MSREREVKVTILGEDRGAGRVLNDLGDHADRTGNRFDGLGSKLSSFGKVAAIGLGAAAVGVGAFLKSSMDAAEESRKVTAQTEAVLKSTGGVAKVSAGDVDRLSSSLSAMSGIDDEVIAGGQNMLLTFTNVRNEVGKGNDIFNQGTKAALNMSVALGTDMNSASMLVGKALNDPIKGMAALTKSGIQFTTQQKDQVKAMVAAGDVMGAQKIILKELETQFGGSAEAAASPMARLKVVVGNLQEEIGARLLPVLGTAATFLANVLPGALDKVGAVIGPVFAGITRGWAFLVAGFNDPAAVQGPANFLDVLFNLGARVKVVFDTVKAVVYDFVVAFKLAMSGEQFDAETGPQRVAKAIVQVVQQVVAFVQENWPKIQETISSVLATVVAVISGFVDVAMTIWNNFGEQIVSYVQGAFEAAMEIVGGAMDVIQGIVATVTAIIHGDWSAAWDGIKQILAGAWEFMNGLADQAMNIMQTLVSIGMEILASIISSAFEGIVGFVESIPGRIVGALGDLGGLLFSAGQDLIWGFLNGIASMAHRLADAAVNVARGAVNAVKNFLGIGSPSKLFMGFGVNVGEGFALGMGKSEGGVARAGNSLAGAAVPGLGSGGSLSSLSLAARGGGAPGGSLAPQDVVAAFTAALAPFMAKLQQAGMTNVFPPGTDPLHVAREIAWAIGA